MKTTFAMRTAVAVFFMVIGIQTAYGGSSVPPEKRAEFRQLVAQRDRLHDALWKLDGKAAEAIKNEEKPVKLHAEQISTQDELDLVQLQLETLAMRWDLAIPLPPSDDDQNDGKDTSDGSDDVSAEFERGRQRALGLIGTQVFQMLASLDFEEFLSRTDGE